MTSRGMRRLFVCMVLALIAFEALAASPRALRKQLVASMVVTGSVLIDTDGSVAEWALDQREALPGEVVNLVAQTVPTWRFEPIEIDGRPVRGDARMSLRILASPSEDEGSFQITVADGRFGRDALTKSEREAKGLTHHFVTAESMQPPAYPALALRTNVQGTVYLALRVDRQGAVVDAMVEQVNLRTVGSQVEQERMRRLLARPALEAARGWRFRAPREGDSARQDEWTVRIPVSFHLGTHVAESRYGQWESYLPGPRQPVPWRTPEEPFSPDLLADNEVHQAGTSIRLLSPIGG